MQRVAQGTASRRSTVIGLPQTTQVPYVPSSARWSAASTSAIRWSAFSSSPSSSSRMYVSVAVSASSPAPVERSPVSSVTERSWFTPLRAARSLSSSCSSSAAKVIEVEAHVASRAASRRSASSRRDALYEYGLVPRGMPPTNLDAPAWDLERLGEQVDDGPVRLSVLWRGIDADLPGISVTADDLGTGSSGAYAQPQAGAQAIHGPKDIRATRSPTRRPRGCPGP